MVAEGEGASLFVVSEAYLRGIEIRSRYSRHGSSTITSEAYLRGIEIEGMAEFARLRLTRLKPTYEGLKYLRHERRGHDGPPV